MPDVPSQPSAPSAEKRESFLSLRVDPWRVFTRLVALVCLAALLGYLGRVWWPLQNAGHFRAHYFLVLGAASIVFALGKRRNAALVTLAFSLANAVSIVPHYFGAETPPGRATFRIMECNVHTGNRDYARAVKPDAIVFTEVDSAWCGHLRELMDEYPVVKQAPRADNFGLAFYSRTPPRELSIRYIGEAQVPTSVARYDIGGRPLTLVGTHPVPPVNAEYVRFRDEQLARLADAAADTPGAFVLIGDLNMTSESTVFSDVLRRSRRLRDSRQGRGIQPTWPVNFPLLFIAIDHCLVSPEVRVHDRFTGQTSAPTTIRSSSTFRFVNSARLAAFSHRIPTYLHDAWHNSFLPAPPASVCIGRARVRTVQPRTVRRRSHQRRTR